jgi:hypothetical protein
VITARSPDEEEASGPAAGRRLVRSFGFLHLIEWTRFSFVSQELPVEFSVEGEVVQ